jgi:SAM-dependent methyltransferase
MSLAMRGYLTGAAEFFVRYLETRGPSAIAIAGLGTGTLACLGKEHDQVTFFEIDPAVENVARKYFTYLDRCSPRTSIVIGDARQTLGQVDDETYDLLVLDAFSSDAVPVHLLTNEAAQIYERVLKHDGLLAFHISNRYLDLKPVLGRLAKHRDWLAWVLSQEDRPEDALHAPGVFVLATKSRHINQLLGEEHGATPLASPTNFRLWTDDYSNLFKILRW